MSLMEDPRPKNWPISECEFILTPRQEKQLVYHLETECQELDLCMTPLTHHTVAIIALIQLRQLWEDRKPTF